MKFRILLLLSVLLITDSRINAQNSPAGSILGTVVDTNDAPVVGATVTTYHPEETSTKGEWPSTVSDKTGHFRLEAVPPGPNYIFANKLEDYYPETQFGFFTDREKLQLVNVEPGKTIGDIKIQLGGEGGRLKGSIIDTSTNQPVLTARILLTRADDTRFMHEQGPDQNGDFDIIVPSRPFTMIITAPGFNKWRFENQRNKDVVLIAPGQTETVIVKLQKLIRR